MIVTEPLVYKNDTATFEGTVSWDSEQTGKRPAVLVAPTFRGQSAFETEKAEQLAKLGYVGFAVDIYGQGIRASSPEEAAQLMGQLNSDRPKLLSHMRLAADTARNLDQVDKDKIAAIGFCFGGKCVLDLVRSGIEIQGAVTFHGVYDPPPQPATNEIKAALLILHGWEDPLAPREDTVALADELTSRGADWQIHMFGHTAHAFTNPQAQDREGGFFYNNLSCDRAWKMMQAFLAERFE